MVMKKESLKRKMVLFASVAVLMAAFSVTNATAADGCNGAGWLCFKDYETQKYGNVAGNNPDWSKLNGNWNNRADKFKNDGNTHNGCLYDYKNYSTSSYVWFIPNNGLWYTNANAYDRVSSNKWVKGTSISSCL